MVKLVGEKAALCAMSIIHVEVGRVTESLPGNDAYALILFIFGEYAGNFGPAAAAPAAPAPAYGPAWQAPTLWNQQLVT